MLIIRNILEAHLNHHRGGVRFDRVHSTRTSYLKLSITQWIFVNFLFLLWNHFVMIFFFKWMGWILNDWKFYFVKRKHFEIVYFGIIIITIITIHIIHTSTHLLFISVPKHKIGRLSSLHEAKCKFLQNSKRLPENSNFLNWYIPQSSDVLPWSRCNVQLECYLAANTPLSLSLSTVTYIQRLSRHLRSSSSTADLPRDGAPIAHVPRPLG